MQLFIRKVWLQWLCGLGLLCCWLGARGVLAGRFASNSGYGQDRLVSVEGRRTVAVSGYGQGKGRSKAAWCVPWSGVACEQCKARFE